MKNSAQPVASVVRSNSRPGEKSLVEDVITEVVEAPRSRTRKSVSSGEVLAPAPQAEQAINSADTGKQRNSRAKPSKLEQEVPRAVSKEGGGKSKSVANQEEAPAAQVEAVKENCGKSSKSKAAAKVLVLPDDKGHGSKGRSRSAAKQEEVIPAATAPEPEPLRSSRSKLAAKQEPQLASAGGEEKTTGRSKAAKAAAKQEPAEEPPARRSTRRAH